MKSRFSTHFLETSTEVMRAIAHPIRIAIVDLLNQGGPLSVTDIHTRLNIEQAIASHHLGILKNKGVLASRRAGKKTIYMLRDEDVSEMISILERLQAVHAQRGMYGLRVA
jgi:ArsR family transcriptional regulator